METVSIVLFVILFMVATTIMVLLFVLEDSYVTTGENDELVVGEGNRTVLVKVGDVTRQQWTETGTDLFGRVAIDTGAGVSQVWDETGSTLTGDLQVLGGLGAGTVLGSGEFQMGTTSGTEPVTLIQNNIAKITLMDGGPNEMEGDWSVSGTLDLPGGLNITNLSITGNSIESTAASGGLAIGSTNGSNVDDVKIVLGGTDKVIIKESDPSELVGEWSVGQLETGPIQVSEVVLVDDVSGFTNTGSSVVVGTGVTGSISSGSVNVGHSIASSGVGSIQIGSGISGPSVGSVCISSSPMDNKFDECVVLNANGDLTETKQAQSCYINPIRAVEDTTARALCYDNVNKEVVQSVDVHLTANAITSSASSGGLVLGTTEVANEGDVSLVQGGVPKVSLKFGFPGELAGNWSVGGDLNLNGPVTMGNDRVSLTANVVPPSTGYVAVGRNIAGLVLDSTSVGHSINNSGTGSLCMGTTITNSATNSIVLDTSSSPTTNAFANCIILNTDNMFTDSKQSDSCYINPIRTSTNEGLSILCYDPLTFEVTQQAQSLKRVVLVGYDVTESNVQFSSSAGSNFGPVSNVPPDGVRDVIYVAERGMWLCCGDGVDFTGGFSYDGKIWGNSSQVSMTVCSKIAYHANQFVRGGTGNSTNFELSSNGIDFTALTVLPFNTDVVALTGNMANEVMLVQGNLTAPQLCSLNIYNDSVNAIATANIAVSGGATHDSRLQGGNGLFYVYVETDTSTGQALRFTTDWTAITVAGDWTVVNIATESSNQNTQFIQYVTESAGQHYYVIGNSNRVVRFSWPNAQVAGMDLSGQLPGVSRIKGATYDGDKLILCCEGGATNILISYNFTDPNPANVTWTSLSMTPLATVHAIVAE